MRRKQVICLWLACISNTLFRYEPFFFEWGKRSENHTSYGVGQAASYLFLLHIIKDVPFVGENKRLFNIASKCAVSNFMDELFFNPVTLGYNELVFALYIVAHEFGWLDPVYNLMKHLLAIATKKINRREKP